MKLIRNLKCSYDEEEKSVAILPNMTIYKKTDNPKNQLILDVINNDVTYKGKLNPNLYETYEEKKERLELIRKYINEVSNWQQSPLWYLNKVHADFSKVEELVLDKRGKCNNINGRLSTPFSIWDIYTSIDFGETLVKGQKLEGGGMSGFANLKRLTIGGKIEIAYNLDKLTKLEELIITSEKYEGNIAQFKGLTNLKKLDIRKERDGVYRTYVKGFTGNLGDLSTLTKLEELNIEGNWALEGGLDQLPDSLVKLHYKNTVYAPILDEFGGDYNLWRSLRDNSKLINLKTWDKTDKKWRIRQITLNEYESELRKELIHSSLESSTYSSRQHNPKNDPRFILDIINREGKPYDLLNDKEIQITSLTNERDNLKNDNEKMKQQTSKDKEEINKLKHDIQNANLKKQQLENDKTQLNTKLTQEQNKNKELENNTISQKDKTIQSLQLKNEKLTDNQKKLYGCLGDAWKLISHLQKDLQTEKQDKVHIQKELDDTLTILNKPTAEMGTQTELTAEQISQMEKDLEYQRQLLYQGALEIDRLEKELTEIEQEKVKTEQEMISLQAKVKDLVLNEDERDFLSNFDDKPFYVNLDNNVLGALMMLEERLDNVNLWKDLRQDFVIIRKRLTDYTNSLIKKRMLEGQMEQKNKEIEKQTQTITELQTKYDMEVRSKEELVKIKADLESKVLTENEIKALDIIGDFNYCLNIYTLETKNLMSVKLFEKHKKSLESLTVKGTGREPISAGRAITATTNDFPHKLGKYSIYGMASLSLSASDSIENCIKEKGKTEADLQKELSWWDKWIADEGEYSEKRINNEFFLHQRRNINNNYRHYIYLVKVNDWREDLKIETSTRKNWIWIKEKIKLIHDYYLSR